MSRRDDEIKNLLQAVGELKEGQHITEEEMEKAYDAGRSAGLREASEHLEVEAGRYFAKEQDAQAVMFRDASKFLKDRSIVILPPSLMKG